MWKEGKKREDSVLNHSRKIKVRAVGGWIIYMKLRIRVMFYLIHASLVVTLDALTPASVHSLWRSPKCLNLLCLTVFSSLHHPCCLCTFYYPISSFQSTLHLKCFDTALLEQPLLSVMTLCDLPSLWRVLMIIFWTIAKSTVFPIIVISKNKRYPEVILYGWSFIETQM